MNRFAKARSHTPGVMNKTEAAYAARLALLMQSGEIRSYAFECAKFKLAPLTFYTPDFMVVAADDVIEFHEVKGFWEDDARVKIKVFAAMYPFRVRAITYKNKEWVTEEFS